MAKNKQYPICGLAEKLTELCYKNNVPAYKLGEIAGGYNRKTVYGWLHGDTVINSLALAKICAYFHVSSDWLLGLEKVGNNEMAMLIDADELKSVIKEDWFLDILLTQTGKNDMAKKLVDLIDSVPLAYNMDKVVEGLEILSTEVKMILPFSKEAIETKVIASGEAIEIIRRGGMK